MPECTVPVIDRISGSSIDMMNRTAIASAVLLVVSGTDVVSPLFHVS
jgi:hypothetical protein